MAIPIAPPRWEGNRREEGDKMKKDGRRTIMGENGRREESSVGKRMVDRRGGINENKANERGKAVSDRGKWNARKGSESKEKRYGTCLPFVYRKEKVRCFARSSVVTTKRNNGLLSFSFTLSTYYSCIWSMRVLRHRKLSNGRR